jgi:hypothetical protein
MHLLAYCFGNEQLIRAKVRGIGAAFRMNAEFKFKHIKLLITILRNLEYYLREFRHTGVCGLENSCIKIILSLNNLILVKVN